MFASFPFFCSVVCQVVLWMSGTFLLNTSWWVWAARGSRTCMGPSSYTESMYMVTRVPLEHPPGQAGQRPWPPPQGEAVVSGSGSVPGSQGAAGRKQFNQMNRADAPHSHLRPVCSCRTWLPISRSLVKSPQSSLILGKAERADISTAIDAGWFSIFHWEILNLFSLLADIGSWYPKGENTPGIKCSLSHNSPKAWVVDTYWNQG